MPRFQKILVPIDFSEHSAAALENAVELAKVFGAKLHLLHCYPIQPGGISPYGIVIPSSYVAELRKAAAMQLAEWQAKRVPAEIAAESSTSSEAPAEAILQTAKQIGADLIVIGTRGLTGLKHVMLGSVAERTVRFAPCPVLTVHCAEPERNEGE